MPKNYSLQRFNNVLQLIVLHLLYHSLQDLTKSSASNNSSGQTSQSQQKPKAKKLPTSNPGSSGSTGGDQGRKLSAAAELSKAAQQAAASKQQQQQAAAAATMEAYGAVYISELFNQVWPLAQSIFCSLLVKNQNRRFAMRGILMFTHLMFTREDFVLLVSF